MTMQQTKSPSAGSANQVVHLTPQERSLLGKEARARVPRAHARGLRALLVASRPGQSVGAPGGHTGTRARADPLRAHARLALHLLPRRRPDHGVRPGHHASVRSDRPDLRRCPPEQLRTVRVTRAGDDVRRQRLRRDAARALGMGPQAAGRECRHRREGPELLQEGLRRRREGGRDELPEGDAPIGRVGNLDVWYSKVDIEAIIAGLSARAASATSKAKSRRDEQMAAKASSIVAKSRTKDSLQALAKLTTRGGRTAPDHQ